MMMAELPLGLSIILGRKAVPLAHLVKLLASLWIVEKTIIIELQPRREMTVELLAQRA